MAIDPFSCIPSSIWEKSIRKVFNHVIHNRYDCLDHFAINLIVPTGETVNLCTNANYIMTYRRMEMHKFSSGLFPELINHLPVVPWRLLLSYKDRFRLNKYVSFKEVLHGLYSGMSFVHKIDDFYLNVAVATRSQNPKHATTFLTNADDILNLGAYALDVFRSKLEGFYELNIPPIETIVLNDGQYKKIDRFLEDWNNRHMFILPD